MTEISGPYDVTFDFPDMICMCDVASIVAMSHVGTVEAAAPTLAFVYRVIYWPSNCIQASQRDIELHGSKRIFFFSVLLYILSCRSGICIDDNYGIDWFRYEAWRTI